MLLCPDSHAVLCAHLHAFFRMLQFHLLYLLNSSNFIVIHLIVLPNDFAGPVGDCSPVAYWFTEKKKRQPGLINVLSPTGACSPVGDFFLPFQRCCDSMDWIIGAGLSS